MTDSDSDWTVVSNKKPKKKVNVEKDDDYVEPIYEHQDWQPLIIRGKSVPKEKKRHPNVDAVVKKKTTNNKQNEQPINYRKLEKDIEEGKLKPKTIDHELKMQIQKERLNQELSQKELAQKCNLSVFDIQSYEKGDGLYNQIKINRIKKVLGIE